MSDRHAVGALSGQDVDTVRRRSSGRLRMTRIGILTSGGDCPGLNAVIRGAVLKGTEVHAQEFVGFLDGWRGMVDGDVIPLDRSRVRGLAQQGGTILGTSRFGPYQGPTGEHRTSSPHSTGSGSTPSSRSVVRGRPPHRNVCSRKASGSSASPRPSTTTSAGPTTHSASTRPSRSPRSRSTVSAPPAIPTSAAWCSK